MQKLRNLAYNLLRWSEKYTKTDMIYLTKGGFWLTISQVVSSGSAFALSIMFANLLPVETYGIYKYVLSVWPILTIFTLPGLGVATAQSIARGYDGTLNQSLRTRIRWSFLGSIISLGLSFYYYIFKSDQTLALAFIIVAAFLPFFETFGIYDSLLQGKKNFRLSTRAFTASQVIALAVMTLALFLTDNIIIIIIAYFLPWTLTRIYYYLKSKETITSNSIDPGAYRYGFHLSIMNILTTISNYLDRIVLFQFLGPIALAQYTIIVAPIEQIRSLVARVTSALSFPKLAEKSTQGLKISSQLHSSKIFLTSVIVVIAYVATARFLFGIFFPQYIEVTNYSIIYAFTLLPLAATMPTAALSAHGAKKELYILNTTVSVFQIIAVLIGIFTSGLLGLVIARIISRFFNWLVASYLVNNLAK